MRYPALLVRLNREPAEAAAHRIQSADYPPIASRDRRTVQVRLGGAAVGIRIQHLARSFAGAIAGRIQAES